MDNSDSSPGTRYDQLSRLKKSSNQIQEESRSGSIIRTSSSDGTQQVFLRFFDQENDPIEQRIDVSQWTEFPNLWQPFCEALIAWGTVHTARGRYEKVRDLSRGWFEFLRHVPINKTLCIEQIDKSLINRFIHWLNQSDSEGYSRWALGTRRTRLGALKAVLDQLIMNPGSESNQEALRLSSQVPKHVWPGSHRAAVPTRVVDSATLIDLYTACTSEIRRTMAFVNEGQLLIEINRAKLPARASSQSDYKELGLCLAMVDETFADIIPDRWGIRDVNNHLHNAILAYHGFSKIPTYFYPQPRLLVPFVLLFALYTSANADMLTDMKRADFEEQISMGSERIVWRGFKARASRRQRRSFPVDSADDNPATLLDFLDRWTSRLRVNAGKHVKDHVFLFVAKWGGGKKAVTFGPGGNVGRGSSWSHNLNLFLEDHELEKLNLKILRASGLDLVHELFNGDLRAVKAAGGQKNNNTIFNHYTSDSARQRNAERIGESIQLYDRWRESEGASDSRVDLNKEDHGACTPGWCCLDPFSSPIAGQTNGKLCTAYGACPECPHAYVDIESPYALAQLLQLREAIERAQMSLSAERWLSVWGPRLAALNQKWIPRFTSELVISEAAMLDLSPLPELE